MTRSEYMVEFWVIKWVFNAQSATGCSIGGLHHAVLMQMGVRGLYSFKTSRAMRRRRHSRTTPSWNDRWLCSTVCRSGSSVWCLARRRRCCALLLSSSLSTLPRYIDETMTRPTQLVVSRYVMSVSPIIVNLYNAESWSISTALSVVVTRK